MGDKRMGDCAGNAAPRRAPARPLRALLASDAGTTILEFGLIAAPFFALLIAVLATALAFFVQQGLETAAEAAARKIMTGQVQQAGMSQEQFRQAACQQLPPYLNCANLMVDVETADSFQDVNTTAPTITYGANGKPSNAWAYNTGGSGDIVIMRLMYIYPLPTGPLGMNYSNAGPGKRLLVATSVFQSEPYQAS